MPGRQQSSRPVGRPPGGDATETREKILRLSARVFSRHGFAATSMRQLAEATGTSLGAIYYHFSSKEEILRAILCGNFERVSAAAAAAVKGVKEPRQALRAFVANHLSFFARHLEEMRVMSHELDTLTGEAGREATGLRRVYTGIARDILVRLRPELSASELQVAVLSLFGMINWTYRWWHTLPRGADPGSIADQMTSLFLDGFAPRRRKR